MQRRHHVQYDDGEDETLCLEREEWDFLDEDAHITKPEGEPSMQWALHYGTRNES